MKHRHRKWPADLEARLRALVAEGVPRRDIARRMGLGLGRVSMKLLNMGLDVPLGESWHRKYNPVRDPAVFPKFENITPTEAQQASAGAPRSARIPAKAMTNQYSIIGNAAALCAA